MKVNLITAVVVGVALLATVGEALAQARLGGSSRRPGSIQPGRSRTGIGGSLVPSGGDGLRTKMEETAASIGRLEGNERFIRGNREAGDFVGTDSGDRAGFIGSNADNSGPIRSSTTGTLVRTTTGPSINRTRVRSPAPYMYEARLRVGFNVNPGSVAVKETMVAQRLKRTRAIDPTSLIAIRLEGSTAILSGTVGSGRERSLAGMLLMFEPGISSVKNELVVRPPVVIPGHSPSDSEAPKAGDS